jgi:hypothetical protein
VEPREDFDLDMVDFAIRVVLPNQLRTMRGLAPPKARPGQAEQRALLPHAPSRHQYRSNMRGSPVIGVPKVSDLTDLKLLLNFQDFLKAYREFESRPCP